MKLFCVISIFLFAVAAGAAEAPVVSFPDSPPAQLKAGGKVEAALSITVKQGVHVQANPASETYLIPTKLELTAVNDITPGKPAYPKGKELKLDASSPPLAVYDGTFQIKVPLEAKSSAKPGKYTLSGKLSYQACDDRMCLPPTSTPVKLNVQIN